MPDVAQEGAKSNGPVFFLICQLGGGGGGAES